MPNMPMPNVKSESSIFCTYAAVGSTDTAALLRLLPCNPIGGKPGASEPAANDDETFVVGSNKPKPKLISEHGSPLMDAGFQYSAPVASRGAATPAPPID